MTTNQQFSATKPRLGRYVIDPGASSVVFRTRHLFGLAPVRGTFRSGNPARDGSVRSARFLDAGRHPVMVFVAGTMEGDALDGALTVCGTTRPVRLPLEVSTLPDGSLQARAAVRIDRTEFGITASPGLAGRYLDLTAEVRCVRRG